MKQYPPFYATAVRLCSAVAMFSLGLSSARAFDYIWTNGTADQDWATTGNWNGSGGPPTSSDTANFQNTYSLFSNADVTITQLAFFNPNANITIDFNGNTLTATSSGAAIDFGSSNNMQMTIRDGAYNFASGMNIYSNTGLTTGKTFTMDGATTSFAGDFNVASEAGQTGATTTVNVQNGSNVTAGNVRVGQRAEAVLNVTGSGTTLTNTGGAKGFQISHPSFSGNSATVNVTSGASVNGNYLVSVWNGGSGATGTLSISGSGSSFTTTNTNQVEIGYPGVPSNGASLLEAKSGGSFTSAGSILVYDNGTIYAGGGSSVTASDPGNTRSISIGDNTADNDGARLMGSGTVTTDVLNMYGVLQVGDSPSAAGVGTLSITANMGMSTLANTYLDFDSASSFDKIAITGNLSGAAGSLGALTLNFNYAPADNTVFTLFTTTGSRGGVFDVVNWNGAAGSIAYGSNYIEITTVPEPQVFFYLLTAGTALVVYRLRKKGPSA